MWTSSTDEKSTGPSPGAKKQSTTLWPPPRGQVDGNAFGTERIDEALEQRLQIQLLRIDLVHHHHAREPALRRGLHHPPGDHLNPLSRVHDHRRGLHRREDRYRPTEEVGIAGGIHEVHVPGAVIETRDAVYSEC